MPAVARVDPQLRLLDYCAALDHYLNLPDSSVRRIILLENSGADPQPLLERARIYRSGKSLEVISTNPDYPTNLGKGYGEFLMLDEGLREAHARQAIDRFWKVTGRLKVLNFQQLVSCAPANYDVYCDLRDVPLIGHRFGGNQWMDLRLFSCSMAGYDHYFRGKYASGSVLEQAFFVPLKRQWSERPTQIIPRFRVQPDLAGISGFSNASYQNTSYRLKTGLRRVCRSALPFLWL